MAEPLVVVDGISRTFGDEEVLKNVSFRLGSGEHLVIRGPSGSGKSTLLRIICGLECADSGGLALAGISTIRLCVRRRKAIPTPLLIGYAPQATDLWDFHTARDNVLLPLKVRGVNPDQARRRVDELLDAFHLSEQRDRYPAQLSGGERQRIAVARALALDPDLLLLDEPTANLDEALADCVWKEVLSVTRGGAAAIVATHSRTMIPESQTLLLPGRTGRKTGEAQGHGGVN